MKATFEFLILFPIALLVSAFEFWGWLWFEAIPNGLDKLRGKHERR